MTSTWDASASDAAPAEEPEAEATAPAEGPAVARPRRRPTEVHSISQLTTDEIVAELDRMDLDGAWDQERARGWWETSMEPPSSHLADTGPRILAVQST